MSWLPSLITAAGSLLGGAASKTKDRWITPDYQQIRDKAEAAGFNPLTALTSNAGIGVQGQNYMGTAIADAAMQIGDQQFRKEAQITELRAQKEKLSEQLKQQTLRPKVGGVYAQRAVNGGGNEADPILSLGLGARRPDGAVHTPSNNGSVARTEPLWITVFDKKTGRSFDYPNPDVMDISTGEFLTSTAMLQGADIAHNGVGPTAKGWWQGFKDDLHQANVDRQNAKRIKDQLDRAKKRGFSGPPIPPPRTSRSGAFKIPFGDPRYHNSAW